METGEIAIITALIIGYAAIAWNSWTQYKRLDRKLESTANKLDRRIESIEDKVSDAARNKGRYDVLTAHSHTHEPQHPPQPPPTNLPPKSPPITGGFLLHPPQSNKPHLTTYPPSPSYPRKREPRRARRSAIHNPAHPPQSQKSQSKLPLTPQNAFATIHPTTLKT